MQKHRVLVCILAGAAVVLPGTAHASTTGRFIGNSADPLKRIWISTELQCQVRRVGAGWGGRAFFPPTGNVYNAACGTFLDAAGVTYGPKPPIPAATTFAPPLTPYQFVSQVVTHAGSVQCIRTVVEAGTDYELEQGDCYISGKTYFETTVVVSNKTTATKKVRIARAANCFVKGSTTGRGSSSVFHRVYCTKAGSNSIAVGDSEGFIPTNSFGVPATAGPFRFTESPQNQVWPRVSGAWLNNTVAPMPNHDNGMALGTPLSIPSGGSASFSLRTTF